MKMRSSFDMADIQIGGGAPLVLIAGPCVLESEELANRICGTIASMAAKLGIGFIFKSSYDKANRQRLDSFRGPGMERGLDILAGLREHHGVPVLTDVHTPEEAQRASTVVDVIQIPAFLCRQTDLAVACGATGLPVFAKKGQFMAPEDMRATAEKVVHGGSDRVVLVERGTSFGYHDLVVDMRSLVTMHRIGCPVVFDCTHSVQRPGAGGGTSGGDPAFIEPLSRAAVACGVDGVFIETHPDCEHALCDAATMLPLHRLEALMTQLVDLHGCLKR